MHITAVVWQQSGLDYICYIRLQNLTSCPEAREVFQILLWPSRGELLQDRLYELRSVWLVVRRCFLLATVYQKCRDRRTLRECPQVRGGAQILSIRANRRVRNSVAGGSGEVLTCRRSSRLPPSC